MGMTFQMRRCDAAKAQALRAAPDEVGGFIAPDDYGAIPPGELTDLDKAWHAIHFLLAGTPGEASFPQGALFAGEGLGDDFGLGPPRLLEAAQVKAFADFLSSKPDDFVEQTIDFAALEDADIYPDIWDREDAEDIEYVADNFRRLKGFVLEAAVRGDSIVMLLM